MAADARRVRRVRTLGLSAALLMASGSGYAPDLKAACVALPKLFAEKWIDGTLPQEPFTQVQQLDEDSFVIRQSVKTNFEAPFLYLLFGRDRALLIDSGAEGGRIRPTVDRLVAQWLAAHGRRSIPLVVAHSHSHGDHVAGDAAFRDRPNTTVVGLKPSDVASFFGISHWPEGVANFDLGDRALSVIATPGHQAAAIMIYDPRLKILLSGDTLYPGRLYVPVNFMADNRASIERLAAFAAKHPICAVMGAHIEMTSEPGRDYGHEASTHPDEHPLPLPAQTIGELQTGLREPLETPDQRQVHDHFIIVPVPARAE